MSSTSKPRPGRKPRPVGKSWEQLHLRCTLGELDKIRELAASNNQTVSEYVRRKALGE